MDQLERFVSNVGAFIAAAFSVIVTLLFPKVSAPQDDYFWLSAIAAGLLIGLTVFASQVAAYLAVNRSRGLRRWLLGNNFVEGFWAEAMLESTSSGKKELRGIAVVNVGFRNGKVQVSGDVFCCNLSPDGSFSSKSASYHDHSLDYSYFGTLHRDDEIPLGHGSIHFGRMQDGAPVTFTGRFSGREMSGAKHTVKVHGRRLSDEESAKWMRFEDRADVLRAVYGQFEQQFPDYQPRDVAARLSSVAA